MRTARIVRKMAAAGLAIAVLNRGAWPPDRLRAQQPEPSAPSGQLAPATPQPAAPPASQPGSLTPGNPDELYKGRTTRTNAEAAADIWEAIAATSFEAAWKLARACYWLGTHGTEAQRRESLERGVKAGELAAKLGPDRPEGYFWMAASMGTLGEAFGMSQGLKYRGRIKEVLERVIAIQPGWQQGSAEAALGRWYAKVPRLLGGNKSKAEAYYKQALEIDRYNRLALIYYAELIEDDRPAEARGFLQRVLEAPPVEDWGPEDTDWTYKTKERLAKIPAR